jgi:hypothetical protein
MNKIAKIVKNVPSAMFLACAQSTVLAAVKMSQLGERMIRGTNGFNAYREELTRESRDSRSSAAPSKFRYT